VFDINIFSNLLYNTESDYEVSFVVWIQFVICLAIIVIAGTRLSRYGDIIAEKSGLGRIWVGIVLLATVTSLPEVATGISSVAIVKIPDLAIGDLFGSALINLAILAVVDLVYKKGPVLHGLGNGIVLATILSMLLLAAGAASIFLAHDVFNPSIFGLIGISSLLLFCLYLVSQYMLFHFKTRQLDPVDNVNAQSNDYTLVSLKKTYLYFGLTAIAIVAAGIWLGTIGDQIAESTGLKASFVGTLFLAISTSAPEMVVSISAARMGALEMAVANIVGSNLFNMGVVIFLDDLVYSEGPILGGVSSGHILTALFALMMSSVVVIGIIFRPKLWMKAWMGMDTIFIGILYISALVSLYFYGK
jgi:cation:H+ antiporter